jgi:hypothetical protein
MKRQITLDNFPNRIVKFGSLFFNLAALVVTIFGYRSGDDIKKIVFVILFISYLIIAACIVFTLLYNFHVRNNANFNKKAMESIKNFNSDLMVFNKDMIKNTNFTLASFWLQNNKYKDFMNLIQRKAGNLALIPTGDLSAFQEEIEKRNQEHARDLVQLYNDYLRSIVNDNKKILETALDIKGYQLVVTVTLKLMSRVLEGEDSHKNIRIISAFRDSEASRNTEREIGKQEYTIDKSIDFVTCLRKEIFIKNNAKKGDGDYYNEHIDFDQYYNCTITVPIYSEYAGEKKYFGYLCCDVLNENDDNAIVFDIDEANILSSTAYNLSLFFDNINSIWKEMLYESKDNDFNNHIFRILTEKKKN